MSLGGKKPTYEQGCTPPRLIPVRGPRHRLRLRDAPARARSEGVATSVAIPGATLPAGEVGRSGVYTGFLARFLVEHPPAAPAT